MALINAPYADWSALVLAQGWQEYHEVLPEADTVLGYAGTVEHQVKALITGADFMAWGTDHSDSIEVPNSEAARFQIFKALLPKFGVPRALDGTPHVAQRILVLGRKALTRTDDGTELMNIDGKAAGAANVVWNGTGGGDTGGDWTAGGEGAEDAASHKTGTNGWNTGVTDLNDQTILDNGSMTDIVGTYSTLEFWVQPKAYPTASRLRVRWVDDNNDLVGTQVKVEDYLPNMDLDTWQQVSIPIADFGLTGNVQKLQIRYRNTAGQHYWFDDFDLLNLAGGGPYRFRIAAPAGQRYHLSMLVLKITAPASGWLDSAFGNVAGGLGRGLICRQRRISDGEVAWQFVVRDNDELGGLFHPQESTIWANDVLTSGYMVKPGKADVVVTDDDVVEFVVRDDLSDITKMRAYFHYGVEELG